PEQRATKLSAPIIVHLRFQRSTKTPAKGPNKACGNKAAIVANDNTSADPVLRLIHKTIENWAIELLSIENSCPVHIMINFFFQLFIISLIKNEIISLLHLYRRRKNRIPP